MNLTGGEDLYDDLDGLFLNLFSPLEGSFCMHFPSFGGSKVYDYVARIMALIKHFAHILSTSKDRCRSTRRSDVIANIALSVTLARLQ